MNRVYLTGLALGVLITGYVVLDRSAQESSIIKTDYAAESNIPSTEKAQSSKLNTNIDNAQTSQLDSSPTETEAQEVDLAYQYQEAIREFEVLTPSEQLQKRKLSLSKVIAGEKISISDKVALQQDWERTGTAEPGYQHKKESYSTVDVNSVAVETGKPGVIIENSVMVYIPVGKSSFAAELNAVSGIENIEQVFKSTKILKTAGVRDPAGWHRIDLSAPASRIKSIVRALKSFSDVTEAEPVYERKLSITGPLISDLNDPKMTDQWHLGASKVNEAWEYLEANSLPAGGDESIVVAVIDSGVDFDHADLAANMWVNTQEIPGNNIDDDNNGFVDDIHGVTVVGERSNHSGNPDDDQGHGTHVAGIIASTGGNGVGGVGVAYNSKIMAIKAAQYSGVLTTADIAEGIMYAIDNGADIINMSFGGYGRSQIVEDTLATAYSNAVLVAAAGNDSTPNQPCPIIGSAQYPASYPWVLGVMSRNQNPNSVGDYLSSFSNRECIKNNYSEYELMAPGAKIWSTLPADSYSNWSGTSMAAPIVAGIAALARTKWPDKSIYSSRFIMGQVGATGPSLQAFTPYKKPPVSYLQADAYRALTLTPSPELSYEEHWLFDETDLGATNDNDGRVDAGETIELAIVIRNRWGKADNVVATLSTPSNASAADPYVTFQTAAVNYGAVGSFNKDDNGIEYSDELEVTGVGNPFVFSVDSNTPNNHIIPFTLTMTAENGLDPSDSNNYTFVSTFRLIVQKGRELPSILNSDASGTDGGLLDTDGIENGVITLDNSALWIIDKPVLVDKGVTLKITEGAEVQFWGSKPDSAYTIWRPAYLQVEGKLDIKGTASDPVNLFPSDLFPGRYVHIFRADTDDTEINMQYSRVGNICATRGFYGGTAWNTVDYNYFYRSYNWSGITGCITDLTEPGSGHTAVKLPRAEKPMVGNRFYKLGSNYTQLIEGNLEMSLVDSFNFSLGAPASDTVFLKNRSKNGPYTYGSHFGRIALAVDHIAVEPMIYQDKTYVVFYSRNWTSSYYENRDYLQKFFINYAKQFSRHVGGSIYTPSSIDEISAVGSWLNGFGNTDWETTYPKCKTVDGLNVCKIQIGFGWRNNIHFGAIRQPDGTYAWDGDTNGYNYFESVGWDPSRGEANILSINGSGEFLPSRAESATNGYGFGYILELNGELSQSDIDSKILSFKETSTELFKNNAILNVWKDLTPKHWATVTSQNDIDDWDAILDVSGNFWGGASDTLIEFAIDDFSDDFNKAPARYKPVLQTAPSTAYPFVSDVQVLDGDGTRPEGDRFGAQTSRWRITFNRDMDTTLQPSVTFGPAEPFTDFSIPGDWIDSRTWEGGFTFNSLNGDGVQNIRIVGAVAADNSWLVTGDDSERFQFELVTSGTDALNLQALGARDSILLSWIQDDFELLHGYNLYRSMSEDGPYTRLNSSTINKTITEYADTDVTPGIQHYYYFTVVSDSGESSPSNIAVATPVDTIDPVITHKTEAVVSLDDSLTLRATVTDNIAVENVNIVFRNASSSTWQTRAMLLPDPDANRYSVTMSGSDIGNQFLEYYIEAKDAVNTVTSGSAESPFKVFVSLPSDTDTDGDGVNNADDAFPYDPSETTDLDGDGIGDNADLDDDGDNYNDDVDVFPRDASEWIDTDGDGIGNNRDTDDDNDGVEDGADQFPLDVRGSKDSDNDGMPDQWETDNGLDPNDASDAESDTDFDGFTALQEFEADTSPLVSDQNTQIIYHEFSPFVAGFSNNVKVLYRPSDGVSGLNGLGLRVHYNSQLVEPLVIENILLLDLVSLGTAPMPDTADFDNDPSTDSFINIAWAATSGSSWPGESPVKLFDMKVKFSDSVTADSTINIKFTSSSTQSGYGFSSVPIKTSVNLNSLDIDGNGNPDALSDGLLILRSLFGLTDGALIQNVVATDATFTSASEIQSRINNLGEFLDIDGNEAVDPLSDGLLILRYMFGIRGADLINGVIAPDATRTTADQVEAYLAKMIPSI